MRKVNLRNVDPAIDDPDASTWCKSFFFLFVFPFLISTLHTAHPTLNRHSPPEVVANFKRRVPPRLPKPRKRDVQDHSSIPPPRSAMGIGPVPLTVPSSVSNHNKLINSAVSGRARGFSLPSTMAPLNHTNSSAWNNNYSRSALPPLLVPSDPPQNAIYAQHTLHPADDPSANNFHSISAYSSSARDIVVPSSQYTHTTDQNNWSSFNNGYNPSSSHNGSLSSLLNPSHNGYSRPNPTINTSYTSPFSSMPLQSEHSASSLSPDSRPTTGYSISSVSSLPYQDDYSRPSSSHHRPISPPRPNSSKSNYGPASLSIRRARRHSQAMSPYPNPYDQNEQQRPSTSPTPIDDHQTHPGGIPRVRSMIQLPSVDPYNFSNNQAEFAYSALPSHHQVGHAPSMESMNDANGWGARNVRPSTSASSISAASHTSSSQANTPPIQENFNGETDINRCKSSFLNDGGYYVRPTACSLLCFAGLLLVIFVVLVLTRI